MVPPVAVTDPLPPLPHLPFAVVNVKLGGGIDVTAAVCIELQPLASLTVTV